MTKSFVDILREENNVTTTANGDKAYKSTLNKNLDLFYQMGALRGCDDELIEYFTDAYYENEVLALANALYLRDIRNGIGERDSFRVIFDKYIEYFSENKNASKKLITEMLIAIPEVGRWDDFVRLIDSKNKDVKNLVIGAVRAQLTRDIYEEHPSLLAKWMPSENASNKETIKLAKKWIRALDMSPKKYRKTLSTLRRKIGIVEENLRKKDYTFEYDKIPSRAFNKYTQAFRRNDGERFTDFMSSVQSGEKELKVDNLYPYEIIRKLNTDEEVACEMWDSIKLPKDARNTLVLRDGSASMTWGVAVRPLDIADSLTLLFSQNLEGIFKDSFITFSSEPEFVEVKGNLKERYNKLHRYTDCRNTDLDKTFNLLLKVSKKAQKEDYIERIVIVSDMQFDECMDNGYDNDYNGTVEKYKKLFEKQGIPFPEIVFWNVNAIYGTVPVKDLENVKLLSGFSTNILESIINDNTANATDYMIETLEPYIERLVG